MSFMAKVKGSGCMVEDLHKTCTLEFWDSALGFRVESNIYCLWFGGWRLGSGSLGKSNFRVCSLGSGRTFRLLSVFKSPLEMKVIGLKYGSEDVGIRRQGLGLCVQDLGKCKFKKSRIRVQGIKLVYKSWHQ